jgi:hypothetical protein
LNERWEEFSTKFVEDGKLVTRKERGNCCLKLKIRLKGPKNNEFKKKRRRKQGVCHIAALPFTLKRILKHILRQKKNYEKFKYFTMQKYNLQRKSSKGKTKIIQNIL